MNILKVYTDGASRGNPGPAGIGIVAYDDNNFILESYKEFIGTCSNNQAEYKALLKSIDVIKKVIEKGEYPFELIEFFLDSELIVNQVNFDYQVKEPELALLNNKFHVKMKKLAKPYTISHIPRELNKAADRLANLAIDNHKST
jgi:ribonuclease HI